MNKGKDSLIDSIGKKEGGREAHGGKSAPSSDFKLSDSFHASRQKTKLCAPSRSNLADQSSSQQARFFTNRQKKIKCNSFYKTFPPFLTRGALLRALQYSRRIDFDGTMIQITKKLRACLQMYLNVDDLSLGCCLQNRLLKCSSSFGHILLLGFGGNCRLLGGAGVAEGRACLALPCLGGTSSMSLHDVLVDDKHSWLVNVKITWQQRWMVHEVLV